jgi:hypothetical protein
MSRTHLLFYATESDLASLLSWLEEQTKLQYTPTGLFDDGVPQAYLSYADIPDFGRPNHPSATVGPSFLVAVQGTPIQPYPVSRRDGGSRIAIDQRVNADTIVFWPGGRFGDKVVLYGQIGTVSDSVASKHLYDFMAKLFRKRFAKVREFLVGPEAMSLGRSGVRLALTASNPQGFYLKL